MGAIFWLVYLGPTLAAVINRYVTRAELRRPLWQIFLVNLLTGWTVIGWIIAFAMIQKPRAGPATRGVPPHTASADPEAGANQGSCFTCGVTGRVSCPKCMGRGTWYEAPVGEHGTAQ